MNLTQLGYPAHNDRAIRYFQESAGLSVDGVFGPLSNAAAERVQRAGGYITPHFTVNEFACKHCGWPRVHHTLLAGLERLRARYYSGGLSIVSGYRCETHNTNIGGARGSQHTLGRAADIPPRVSVDTVASLRLFSGLEYQPKISGRSCVHVDTRTSASSSNPNIFAWG